MFAQPPTNTDCVFEFSVTNFNPTITHKRKRPLAGVLRDKVAAQLVDGNKAPSVWRSDRAKECMQFSDDIPTNIPNEATLCKAKQQELEKRYGLETNDPILNLQEFKHGKFMGSIHSIGHDPFYCLYWTKEQIEMYKIGNCFQNSFVSFDATGSIILKLKLPNKQKSPHIFLYQMSVNDMRSFPVFQMLSAAQDAAMISYFLRLEKQMHNHLVLLLQILGPLYYLQSLQYLLTVAI